MHQKVTLFSHSLTVTQCLLTLWNKYKFTSFFSPEEIQIQNAAANLEFNLNLNLIVCYTQHLPTSLVSFSSASSSYAVCTAAHTLPPVEFRVVIPCIFRRAKQEHTERQARQPTNQPNAKRSLSPLHSHHSLPPLTALRLSTLSLACLLVCPSITKHRLVLNNNLSLSSSLSNNFFDHFFHY